MSALLKQGRLIIPARKEGEQVKARPCLGDKQAQFEKAGKMSLERYENAYRELAKV
ncbi:hypothetical protein [Vreelandella massiliensis]|uniref:hypothetical protein n=1 Tax=Vreelandella massiliensis TaxID=1816686 RepID=UPI0013FD0A9B|nr:hypothetical protein [Halomonas massiliensis]